MIPPAWSFSALKSYLTCPSRHWRVRVKKEFTEDYQPEEGYGTDFHKAAENYIKHGDEAPLPKMFEKHKGYLDMWRKLAQLGTLYIEHEMAIDRTLKPCKWYGRQVFARAKGDVIVIAGAHAFAGDHKTGKRRKFEELDQMMVTAMLVFYHFPAVQTVKTGYFWLKEGKKDTNIFHRKDIHTMWNILLPILKEYKGAFHAENFPPRQSGLCAGYCPVTSCQFWSPKKPKR